MPAATWAGLLRDPAQRINFNTVAAAAAVTKAYLDQEPALRERIDLLRRNQELARRRLAPVAERTEASTKLLLIAKERRIRELDAEVARLTAALERCRGQLYERL